MKILALDSNHELLNKGLREAGFYVEEDYTSSPEEIQNKLADFDGIIIRSRIPLNREFLKRASNLKFIGRVGAGLENIDEAYAASKNIQLFNAPEGNRDAVAEHTVAMLLILLHRIRIADHEVRSGIWKREENRGDELMLKTVGIIGYGHMGKAFAQRLKGFDVKVLCYDILPDKGDENALQVGLDEIFQQADIISLHTPQTSETKGMVNGAFLTNFHKPIYFLNTARGKSVVTKDLVKAVQSGKILGACLDVHEYEKSSFENMNFEELPEDFQYLLQSDKVIVTPHIAGWTIQSKKKLAEVILNKIVDWKNNA